MPAYSPITPRGININPLVCASRLLGFGKSWSEHPQTPNCAPAFIILSRKMLMSGTPRVPLLTLDIPSFNIRVTFISRILLSLT